MMASRVMGRRDSEKRIIGTKYLAYSEKRNIALPFARHEVHRTKDLYVYLAAAHLRLRRFPKQTWINHHQDFGLGNCVGYHFWNAVSASSKPWVTTLELPCKEEKRLKYLARPQCRKIFCLSGWVLDFERCYLENSPYAADILPKLQLLHPAQEPNIEAHELQAKKLWPLRFIFVGRDFFRKGGYECVKAFVELLDQGFEGELIVVSKMDTNDYPAPASSDALAHAWQLIDQSAGRIKVFPELSYIQVLDLIKSSHVGLLPTFLDSYGYSVLEFFSCGLPVITTAINALGEINHSTRGWILGLPLFEVGYGIKRFKRNTDEERRKISAQLTQILYHRMKTILENPASVKTKGRQALDYITSHHQTRQNIDIIEEIYDQF